MVRFETGKVGSLQAAAQVARVECRRLLHEIPDQRGRSSFREQTETAHGPPCPGEAAIEGKVDHLVADLGRAGASMAAAELVAYQAEAASDLACLGSGSAELAAACKRVPWLF